MINNATLIVGLVMALIAPVTQAADIGKPIQRTVVPLGTACTTADESALDEKFHLCTGGKWRKIPKLITWAEGTSIYDQQTGCVYQINRGVNGLETVVVGPLDKCGTSREFRGKLRYVAETMERR